MPRDTLHQLQSLSDLQKQADTERNQLRYEHRLLEPKSIDSITPARKVTSIYLNLKYRIHILSQMGLDKHEIAEYVGMPQNVVDAILNPADTDKGTLLTESTEWDKEQPA